MARQIKNTDCFLFLTHRVLLEQIGGRRHLVVSEETSEADITVLAEQVEPNREVGGARHRRRARHNPNTVDDNWKPHVVIYIFNAIQWDSKSGKTENWLTRKRRMVGPDGGELVDGVPAQLDVRVRKPQFVAVYRVADTDLKQ